MSVKTTGIEFKKFYNDSSFWPTYACYKGAKIAVNGANWIDAYEEIPDIAVVTICGGVIYGSEDPNKGISFEGLFRKWRRHQTVTILAVEVSNDVLEDVLRRLAEIDLRVLVK